MHCTTHKSAAFWWRCWWWLILTTAKQMCLVMQWMLKLYQCHSATPDIVFCLHLTTSSPPPAPRFFPFQVNHKFSRLSSHHICKALNIKFNTNTTVINTRNRRLHHVVTITWKKQQSNITNKCLTGSLCWWHKCTVHTSYRCRADVLQLSTHNITSNFDTYAYYTQRNSSTLTSTDNMMPYISATSVVNNAKFAMKSHT